MHTKNALLQQVADNLRDGNVRCAVLLRSELLSQLEPESWNPADVVLRARAAQLSLIMIARKQAVTALEPYLEQDLPSGAAVSRLEAIDDGLAGGLVLTQLANLMFRRFEAKLGDQLAERADACYRNCRTAVRPIDLELAIAENRLFWSRLRWRAGRQGDAEDMLDDTIAQLRRALTAERDGGRQVMLGCACDLKSSFVQSKGQDGRRWGYEALYLLNDARIDDPIRTAHALLALGRSEASHSRGTLMPAVSMLRRSADLFRSVSHPFRARALVQLATTYAKAGLAGQARAVLEGEDFSDIDDADESRWVKADQLLLDLFLKENEARNDGAMWPEALEAARALFDPKLGKLPPRINAERHLHLGIALTFAGDSAEAREALLRAKELADTHKIERVKAAACLALVERGLRRDERWSALESAWLEADHLLSSMNSSYLSQWRNRLTGQIAPADHTVRVPVSRPLAEAREFLTSEYVRYHWQHSNGNMDAFESRTGLGRAQAYRLTEDIRDGIGRRRTAESDKSQ